MYTEHEERFMPRRFHHSMEQCPQEVSRSLKDLTGTCWQGTFYGPTLHQRFLKTTRTALIVPMWATLKIPATSPTFINLGFKWKKTLQCTRTSRGNSMVKEQNLWRLGQFLFLFIKKLYACNNKLLFCLHMMLNSPHIPSCMHLSIQKALHTV